MKKTKEPIKLAALFAANLTHHRTKMDLSQSALGARAGYSLGHVSMLERGERTPTLEAIEHLAAALNVKDPREMFRDRRKP